MAKAAVMENAPASNLRSALTAECGGEYHQVYKVGKATEKDKPQVN